MSISTRKDSSSNITGVLCVGQDLTEVIQYREGLENLVEERTLELNQALKKEKELVEMKSKFVSIASHEFRTPLSTIALATGFIRKYKSKITLDEIDKKLDNIEKQINQMVYLLDDVLLVGKAEAGKMKVNLTQIEIGIFEKLANEVVESLKTSHQLHFQADYSASLFISDEKLIRNIIINLITNAVKFSPGADRVDMSVHCRKNELAIVVKDHGIGIPDEDRNTLFESFQRGSNVGTISGTGLGLSIVKKAVELLDGKIAVNSKINAGSEFRISLPMK
jgi:Signal transduction histidine kinase